MLTEKLARLWRVDDTPHSTPNLVVLVSFGATGGNLTRGARATMEKARWLRENLPGPRERCPDVPIAFGIFTGSAPSGIEERVKREFLNGNPLIFAGEVQSTIEEAEKIRAILPLGLLWGRIDVVTDEWHSRSAKMIWEEVCPEAIIRVITVPSTDTIDKDSPMFFARWHWTWALINVARHLFLVLVPGSIRLMKWLNLHQPG